MECLEETIRRYTLYDPQSQDIEVVSIMMMAFIFQSVPDIREKLLSLECCREMSVWDLVLVAERSMIIGLVRRKDKKSSTRSAC